MKKKGIIEIQFNWIFILIVGAIILMFFISIVVQQSRMSTKKIAASISFDMGSIFSGAQISTNTEHIVDIPPLNIYFTCEDDFSSYRIQDTEIPIEDSLIVFSPSYVLGSNRKLLTWSLDWNMPYRATNFLFITSPVARYIIVNGSYNTAFDVYDTLPDQMMKSEMVYSDINSIDDRNNYRVRIVKFYQSSFDPMLPLPLNVPPALASLDDQAVSMIYVNPINPSKGSLNGYGEIYFYQKNGTVFSRIGMVHYVGEASVYGAIFSEDIENYKCNMKKAFERLNLLTTIYQKRANGLRDYYSTNPDPQFCSSKIQDALMDMDDIKTESSNYISGSSSIDTYVVSLRDKNRILQRHSCPLIY